VGFLAPPDTVRLIQNALSASLLSNEYLKIGTQYEYRYKNAVELRHVFMLRIGKIKAPE
jgi:hypothetical protein